MNKLCSCAIAKEGCHRNIVRACLESVNLELWPLKIHRGQQRAPFLWTHFSAAGLLQHHDRQLAS
jgi:hypothetical protein